MRNSETILSEINEIEEQLQQFPSDENGNINQDAAAHLINKLDELEAEMWSTMQAEKNQL